MRSLAKNKPRYILHPGMVTSISDGSEHYISTPTLGRLYGLTMSNPADGSYKAVAAPYIERMPKEEGYTDIHLYPNPLGNYTLPAL